MSSILVLAQEPGSMERIHSALGVEGWRVCMVQEAAQAIQVAALEAPDLVIVSTAVAGADALAGSFSRSAGGPGLVGLLPERAEAGHSGFPADELVAEPFSDEDLRTVVRRALAARPSSPAPRPKLTSHDIFGDVLAEVESASDDGAPAPVARPAAPAPPLRTPPIPAAPPRPAPAPPPAAASSAAASKEIDRRLEETLSGVLGTDLRPRPPVPAPVPPTRPAAPPRKPDLGSDEDLDAILSKTLSSLDMSRPKPAAPAARPPVAPPPAPTPQAAAPQVPPPQGPPKPQAAPAPPISATAPPTEGTAVRKAPKPMDLGLAEIEELARPRRKPEGTAPPVQAPAEPPFGVRTEPIQRPPEVKPVPAPSPPADLAPPIVPIVPVAPIAPVAPIIPPQPAAPVSVMSGDRSPADLASTQRISVVMPDEPGSQPGEPFGQYSLLEKIAVGGMAEVWKARMRGVEGFQKMVAIKKILAHMSENSEFIGMFIDEAKLAAQLSHPNIVHIYDLGKINRSYYIAMEYVEGKDLRSLLNAGRRRAFPLPMGLALLIAARLASALDYAHRKRDFEGRELGLVHRDVSPQNVLISYDGDVKLCDFGIAKAVSKVGQTQMGALKGKLQYMSPEQAWGRAVDARSDIFSLGAVLFEMLTGERLFSGESEMSVLEAVRQGRTRSPRDVAPSIPAEVDEIVTHALAPIQSRFQTAGEMSQRIEAVLHSIRPSPGPADLAAYIHRLLESEEESDDSAHFLIEPASAPGTGSASVSSSVSTPMPIIPLPPPPEPVEEAAPVAAVAPLGEVRVEETGKRGRGLLYAAIVILLIAIVVTFFLLSRKGAGPAQPPGQPTPAAPSAATVPGAATPSPQAGAAATPPVDLNGLVGEELKKKQQELQKQYDAKAKELEQQIADAKKNGKPLPGTPGAPAQPAAATTGSAPSTAALSAPSPTSPAASSAAPEPASAPVQEPPRSAPQAEPEPPKAQERPTTPPAPAPETPRVKAGDLVPGGPGVTPPELVSAPKPEYPPQARRLQVQGVVVVSVLVDENGRVQDARLIEPIAQKVGINEAALQVARNAQYRPAVKDGVRVKMWTRMRIPFKL
ncbi:MAG TPA: TonB family protein [Thermoanaerobaculia bacterium]|jgi:TonB family protein|nr:TonB family protein [Thermoanaerobaculia bacterium]